MIWKIITGYENYEVSEFGHVRREADHKPLRGTFDQSKGYQKYNLCQNGTCKTFIAARLVLMAFVGAPPFVRAETCHNDGVRTNDHYSNLRWDTTGGNQRDRALHGTKAGRPGEACHLARLSSAQVRIIRDAVRAGVPRKNLCVEYNISSGRISEIITRKTWAHVA